MQIAYDYDVESVIYRYNFDVAVRNPETTTDDFQPIATADILRPLGREGFRVYMVRRDRPNRKGGTLETARHMVFLYHPEHEIMPGVAETAIVMNGSDGNKALQVAHGALRGACFNSCFFGTVEDQLRIIHKGERAREADELFELFMQQREKKIQQAQRLTEIEADHDMQMHLVETLLKLRPVLKNLDTDEILQPLRPDDKANDLWTVYNRVQERGIRGGGFYQTQTGQWRKIRPVKAVDSIRKINQKLWTETLALAA